METWLDLLMRLGGSFEEEEERKMVGESSSVIIPIVPLNSDVVSQT